MSVSKIKTKKGEIRWEVSFHTHGRTSRRLRRRFNRKVDAEEFLENFKLEQAELKKGGPKRASFNDSTFKGLAEYWLERRSIEFSPGHKLRSESILSRILPCIGHLTADHVNPDFLTGYQVKRLKEGVTPSTINRETDCMTAILTFSVRNRKIPYNPASGFRKLREIRSEMKFWSMAEAKTFLEHVNKKHPKNTDERWIYLVYLLAINTGLRAGEIWGLKVKDLTQDETRLRIERQLNAVSRELTHTKGKNTRFVPCNSTLLVELKSLIDRRELKSNDLIFQSATGTPFAQNNFERRHFRKDVKVSGVRKIRFHDLRHTAATLMLASKVELQVVKEILGHKHISTTMNYVHVLGDAVKKAAMQFSVAPESPIDDLSSDLQKSIQDHGPSLGAGDPKDLKATKLSRSKMTKFFRNEKLDCRRQPEGAKDMDVRRSKLKLVK